MKTKSNRILLLSLVPLLAPVAMGAEHENTPHSAETAGHAQSHAWRASDIIGTDVKTSNDDKIGDIKDLVIDFQAGEVLGVVISTGGFLGIGNTLSSVPASQLRYDEQAEAFKTTLTKEQLEQAPRHDDTTWNDDRAGMQERMRTFRETVGTDAEGRDVDNTGRNKRDRRDAKLTPEDQGNSEAELNSTKNIRQAIMDTDLSFSAKNVKIITRNNQVTLRGIVDSAEEHKAVVDIARQHAGEGNVKDEIEVKKD